VASLALHGFCQQSNNGKEATAMGCFSGGKERQQFDFLRRQFLQEGDLPLTDVLTAETVSGALKTI
jgi:hypothetical protein